MVSKTCSRCGQKAPDDARFCPRCGNSLRGVDLDPLLGSVIADRYLVIEKIGGGNSGTVYRGQHTSLGKRVALKVLHHELSRDQAAIERFRREATTVAEIDNEHIVSVIDFGRATDGRLFFAMEYLEGETLSNVLARERRMEVPRIIDIVSQIGEALMEAHAVGFIHRDLRPRNVMLTRKRGRADFVKLLDFGLSKLALPSERSPGQTTLLATADPRYMAPELLRGEAADRRSDIYALGVLTFEMLSGALPYDGATPAVVLGGLEGRQPSLREYRPDVPEWLDQVVQTAMERPIGRRFVTMLKLTECLEAQRLPGPEAALDQVAAQRAAEERAQEEAEARAAAARRAAEERQAAEERSLQAAMRPEVRPASQTIIVPAVAPMPTLTSSPAGGSGLIEASGESASDRPPPKEESGPSVQLAPELVASIADGGWPDEGDTGRYSFVQPRETGEHERVWFDDSLATARVDDQFEDGGDRNRGLLYGLAAGGLLVFAVLAIALWPREKKQVKERSYSEAAVSASLGGEKAKALAQDANAPKPPLPAAAPSATAPIAVDPTEPAAAPTDPIKAPEPSPSVPAPEPTAAVAAPPSPAAKGLERPAPTFPPTDKAEPKQGDSGKKGSEGLREDGARPPAQSMEALLKSARTKLDDGDVTGAVADYKKAKELDPRNGEAVAGIGECAFEQGDYSMAASQLKRAIALSKKARFQVLLGQAYYKLEKFQEAMDECGRVTRSDPGNQEAKNCFAAAQRKLGQ